MYMVIVEEEDWLVNVPDSYLGVLRLLYLSFEQKASSLCIPRDRWDREFFQLQGG